VRRSAADLILAAFFVGSGGLLAAGPAAAAPSLLVRNTIARVTVVPEARGDVAASVVRANPKLPLTIRREGEVVVVDGGLVFRDLNCDRRGGGPGARAFGVGRVALADMPHVLVRMPRTMAIKAGGAVFGDVGPGGGLDLANSGCGDWTVADQAGPLRLAVSGSGDVRAGASGATDVRIVGSGDVALKSARGGLTASIAGSGDVIAEEVRGPLHARVAGSGDLRVHGGEASEMEAAIAGSGDIRFEGLAHSLNVRVAGSGDVTVARVQGPIVKHVAGSGEVLVGH
jgi:hypothetical protein